MSQHNIVRIVYVLSTLLTCIAFGCIIAGTATGFWFTQSDDQLISKHNFGLFTSCTEPPTNIEACTTRDNVLQFADDATWITPLVLEKASTLFDIVLLLLIVSMFFLLLTLLLLVIGSACARDHKRKAILLASGIASILAACFSAGAVGYTAYINSDKLPNDIYTNGWSAILAWVGAALTILTSVITLTSQCFITDIDSHDKYADNNIPIDVRRYDNSGYDNAVTIQNNGVNPSSNNQNPTHVNKPSSRPKSYESESNEPSKRSSKSDFKPELTHDKPLQAKHIYDDNKRNNRYKYTYNPEYMEQQYREESPQITRQTRSKQHASNHYQPQYSPPSGRKNHNNRNSYDDSYNNARNSSQHYQPNYDQDSYNRPSYDNSGYEIR